MPFYCHQCESVFEIGPAAITAQPLCAICGSDFVQQIDDDSENDNNLNDINNTGSNTSSDPALGFALLTRMLAGMNSASLSDSSQPSTGFSSGRYDTPADRDINNNSSNSNSSTGNNATSAQNEDELVQQQQYQGQEEQTSDPANQRRQRISNLVDLLMRLQMQHEGFTAVSLDSDNEDSVNPLLGGGGSGVGATSHPTRAAHPLFRLFGGIGNPRDYVFGQTGIDDIVTQLMEQANRDNAPPHLTDDQIAQLPRTNVRAEDLREQSECAVCQDEFSNEPEGEAAVILSCNHYFHPACIETWLKLNASCPVCRKSVISSASLPAHTPGNSNR
ncbi:hypothetical protein HK100_000637 [Physocladia obscura]|uniref:RING-type domain-containing protein n=1 Tax=Physocladia obscura TaxID=109957 RepID=A0AAD5T0L8_9FUNG|nr:hypothetical protein HK100_000637 [Physocladia obscura]